MDFFRRIRGGSGRKSAPEDADRIATPTPVPGNCSSFGCLQTPVFGCDYLDATGRPCGTKWCREHLGSVTAQGTFCRRHDLVAQSLAQSSGSVIENQRPSREDRRFSLVVLLFLELNQRVQEMLQARFAGIEDVGLDTDMAVRSVRRNAELGWERGWAAFAPAGNLARVVMRVGPAEPPTVKILINQHLVMEATPQWILHRPDSQSERDRLRREFVDDIANEIRAGLDALSSELTTDQHLGYP